MGRNRALNTRPGDGRNSDMDSAPEDDRSSPAGPVVQARLGELIERLAVCDSRIRRHERGGVHQMRVALRRLRSLLATFRPLFDADVVGPLREEVKWVAGELGAARDREVVRERLSRLATGPERRSVAARIDRELGSAESAGAERTLETLDSERYSQLLHDLNSLVADPPWTPDAERSCDDILRLRVRRNWKRLRRRVDRANNEARGDDRRAALHEVRKAAKRLRYSAEALVPAYGDDASRLVRGAKRVQTDLGELQDSVVCQKVLYELTTADGIDEHDAFILGGLHAQERLRAEQAEDHFASSWAKISRKKNRRWLQ